MINALARSLPFSFGGRSIARRVGFPTAKALVATGRPTATVASLASRWYAGPSIEGNQHLVLALGGNALLKRKEPMTIDNQRMNIREGMTSLKGIFQKNAVTMVHGNGPQVGLLVLEGAAYEKESGLQQMTLDVLDAETEGMIGYLLEQEIQPYLTPDRGMATILSQILVDPKDPAFQNPTKFIGPVLTKGEAEKLSVPYKQDGEHYRRVVPSPLPVKMLDNQLKAVKVLSEQGCIVICAGGGGIPCVQDEETGLLRGIEAVIDKDRAACMVGLDLKADGLLILTDVSAVALDFQSDHPKWIKAVSPGMLKSLADHFPAGSMGPKVESVIAFVESSGGRGWAAIGSLKEADKVMAGDAGTLIQNRDGADFIEFYDDEINAMEAA
jgi:carbamate kinase